MSGIGLARTPSDPLGPRTRGEQEHETGTPLKSTAPIRAMLAARVDVRRRYQAKFAEKRWRR